MNGIKRRVHGQRPTRVARFVRHARNGKKSPREERRGRARGLFAGPSDGIVAAGGGAGARLSAVGGGASELAVCATDAKAGEIALGLESDDDAVFFSVGVASIGENFEFTGFESGVCGDAHPLFNFCGFTACGFCFEVHGHQHIARCPLSADRDVGFPKHRAVDTISCEVTDILEVDFDAGLGILAGGIGDHADDDTPRAFFEAAQIDSDLDAAFAAAEASKASDIAADTTDGKLGLECGGEITFVRGRAQGVIVLNGQIGHDGFDGCSGNARTGEVVLQRENLGGLTVFDLEEFGHTAVFVEGVEFKGHLAFHVAIVAGLDHGAADLGGRCFEIRFDLFERRGGLPTSSKNPEGAKSKCTIHPTKSTHLISPFGRSMGPHATRPQFPFAGFHVPSRKPWVSIHPCIVG